MQRLLTSTVSNQLEVTIAGDLAAAQTPIVDGVSFDAAFIDVQLPDGSGVDFIAWLHTQQPKLPAVIVSSWAEETTILAALRNGAIGYLLKSADDEELAMQLRCLQRGGAVIDPLIARRLLALMPQTTTAPAPEGDIHLSAREVEILQLVARGLTNREIAGSIGLSTLTIESHTRNIYRKLAVGSRTAAVFEAQSLGLLH